MMVDAVILQAEQAWPSLAKILYVPRDDADYDRLVGVLDQLIDQVGNDETHPLASLMEVIGVLIERYEDEHVPELDDL
jgi:HTH-type transcriptional regulator / antitoxin HigA